MTTAAPETLTDRLTGQHVTLWPYARGCYPRQTLATLWQMVEQEGGADRIFHAQQAPRETPTPTRGDLVSFVRYFEPEPAGSRLLLMVQSRADDQLAGLFWFDDIVLGHRASANVFYRRRYWGEAAREASRLACRYGFEHLGYRTIWAMTPWPLAVSHAEAIGFERVAVLPGYCLLEETPADLVVLRLEREGFDAG